MPRDDRHPFGWTSEPMSSEEIEQEFNNRKIFLGELVLENFHLFSGDARHVLGAQFWKEYRQRVESFSEQVRKRGGD